MSDGKPAKCLKLENDVYKFEDPVLKSDEEKDHLILFFYRSAKVPLNTPKNTEMCVSTPDKILFAQKHYQIYLSVFKNLSVP